MTNPSNSKSSPITLRGVRPSDSTYILCMENDPQTESFGSDCDRPYTSQQIELFCRSMARSNGVIDQAGQLRLIIELNRKTIGAVDLYNYDNCTGSAYMAIILYPTIHRSKGYGGQALIRMIDHARSIGIERLLCTIDPENQQSRRLFTSCGFALIDSTSDELLLELPLSDHKRFEPKKKLIPKRADTLRDCGAEKKEITLSVAKKS